MRSFRCAAEASPNVRSSMARASVSCVGLEPAQHLDRLGQLDRRLRCVGDQRFERDVQRPCQPPQDRQRRVPLAAFELGQVALRDSRVFGQDLARHPPARPELADPPTDRGEEGAIVADGGVHYHAFYDTGYLHFGSCLWATR